MGIKNNKKQEVVKQPKAPLVIKVKTLVILVAWLASSIVFLYAGWSLRDADNSRVKNEARVMLSQLIDQEKQNQQLSK